MTDMVYDKFITTMGTLANRAAYAVCYDTWSDKFAREEIKDTVNKCKEDVAFEDQRTWDTLISFPVNKLLDLGFRHWNENILCIPLWILTIMPDDISFKGVDIFGTEVTINNKIDNDTRGGVLAYGLKIKK